MYVGHRVVVNNSNTSHKDNKYIIRYLNVKLYLKINNYPPLKS